jgi:choline monooxygenase
MARSSPVAPFCVDPEVERARTLDARFYLDPAVFEAVRESVFARSWLWLADLNEVPAPGHVAPHVLMPGLLDEPLVLARDGAGALRCLSNVCTHRGNLIVPAAGPASQLRCGYHSRRFGLDGRMAFMPGFEGACEFPSAADDLPGAGLVPWQGHALVHLDAAAPPPAWPAWIEQRLAGVVPGGTIDMHGWQPAPERARSFEFEAHWALYVENYLEGLHIPFLHPGLNAALDWSGYRYEQFEGGNLQIALARNGDPAFEPGPGAADHGQRIAAYYFWLYPNLMLNFYPWGLSLNLVLPLAPARTRVVFRSYVADAARLGAGAGAALDPVELEDEAAVVQVQRGLRARLYRGGRYSPQHERGVHQFHRMLAAALR